MHSALQGEEITRKNIVDHIVGPAGSVPLTLVAGTWQVEPTPRPPAQSGGLRWPRHRPRLANPLLTSESCQALVFINGLQAAGGGEQDEVVKAMGQWPVSLT